MNLFTFFELVSLPEDVKKALGVAEPLVSSALNLLAVGIIFFLAFRLFSIAIQGLTEFRNDGDGSAGSKILQTTIISMAATFVAGAVAWILLQFGMPWLLQYATGALGSVANDPTLAQETPVDKFFAKAPLFKTLFTTIRDIASLAVIFFGGLLLAKTGLDAIRNTNYGGGGGGGGGGKGGKGGGGGGGGTAFKGVQEALKRAVMIIILGTVAYVAINVGPELLFGYLNQLQETVNSAPQTQ